MKQRVVHKSKAKADMVYTIQPNRETLLNRSERLNHKHKTDDPKKDMQRRTIVKRNCININSACSKA